jgi:hypothetical protein
MNPNSGVEEALRRALAARAETVPTAPDALGTIRTRIARRRLPVVGSRRNLLVAVVTAVAVALGGGGVAVAAAGGWAIDRHRPTPSPTGTASYRLPVYYLGPVSQGDRLFREYHLQSGRLPGATVAVGMAVQQMLNRPADDPDYRSPWPSGATVRSASVDPGTITVDLAGAAIPTEPVDQLTAQQAVQQLVWTATAVIQGTGSWDVRLLLDGKPATALWGWPVPAGALHRGPAADVLAPIWIIDPQQGSVQGHRFDVSLAGIVFEATMRLRVLDGSGRVVDDQQVLLSSGAPAQGTGRVTLNLTSGRYTIEGYLISERDGTEQVIDDHQFTVG